MLINSFENQTNLAEWFEHRNHYSVVVTRHKDLKRTEYKIQKNDYVYDMLKVKGSVTALVTCAKSLADNFPPTTTTDNKESTKDHTHVVTKVGEVDKGVVDSVGDALFNEHELTVINMVVNHRITLLKVNQKTDLYHQIYKVLLSVEKKTRFNNEQISYEQSLFNKECEL